MNHSNITTRVPQADALPPVSKLPTKDLGKIQIGGASRLPAVAPASVGDSGRIKMGGASRLPAARA